MSVGKTGRPGIAVLVGAVALAGIVATTALPSESALASPAANTTPGSSLPAELPPAVNSEFMLQPCTVHLLRVIEQLFPYYKNGGAIGGYRQDPIADHPSGQALDIMMANSGRDAQSVRDGNVIAAFLMANASQLGVDYMVWRQSIWYPGRSWRLMDDRGHWTHNHMDHIHVKVFGNCTPSHNLLLPDKLTGISIDLPDGEALRVIHEQRVAKQLAVAAAMDAVAAGKAELRAAKRANSARSAILLAAQRKVNGTARQSYMLGMDAELLARSAILLSAETVDPAALVAAERVLRAEGSEVDASLEIVSVTRKRVSEANTTLNQAKRTLADARADLAAFEKEHG